MKITNRQLVPFINSMLGEHSILDRKMPRALYSALAQNRKALQSAMEVYIEQRNEIMDNDFEAINELLDIESEVVIQKVSSEVVDLLDVSDKYDAFSGKEYEAINFMIE